MLLRVTYMFLYVAMFYYQCCYYTVSQKTHHLVTAHYLHQILTDFQNSITGTFCMQFAITWLLNIPPHLKCAVTLPCEI